MAGPDVPVPAAGSGPALRVLTREREASLQARLIARDEEALSELVRLATPWLLGVAQGMLRDQDEAEEVVQEAFTIAWRRADLFDRASGRLLPWLFRITRNRAIDRLRARRRATAKARRLEAFAPPGEGWTPPREPDEAGFPGWHVHEAVHAALRALPPEQAAVVHLAYFEGLTHSEIASRLDIPLGTVKTRLRLAFDKLRVHLAGVKEWAI
jgi:RNA polymerase sigma-70 factor (ECF subfamily)